MESGEGIERKVCRRGSALQLVSGWNPVKELKGSGPVSDTDPRVRMWNPVKELKDFAVGYVIGRAVPGGIR